MVFSYTIADNIFSKMFEKNYELEFEKLKTMVYLLSKNSFFIDCFYDGRYEKLNEDWKLLYDAFKDDIDLKKTLEIIWVDGILRNRITLPNTLKCVCDECSLEKNISEIRKYIKYFPDFILTSETSKKNPSRELCCSNSISDETYMDLFDKTSYKEESLLDFKSGKQKIKKNWTSLIKLCNSKIVILDQNIWSKWRGNYQRGLEQFAEVIYELNKNISLELITKYSPHEDNKSKYEVKSMIEKTIESLRPLKIRLFLSYTPKFDHDRFILFGDKVGAELDRGLDAFYAANRTDEPKIKSYSIIYYYVKEVKSYIAEPMRNLVKESEFKNIKNY
jgi:hypothetical protein